MCEQRYSIIPAVNASVSVSVLQALKDKKPMLSREQPRDAAINLNMLLKIAVNILFSCLCVRDIEAVNLCPLNR